MSLGISSRAAELYTMTYIGDSRKCRFKRGLVFHLSVCVRVYVYHTLRRISFRLRPFPSRFTTTLGQISVNVRRALTGSATMIQSSSPAMTLYRRPIVMHLVFLGIPAPRTTQRLGRTLLLTASSATDPTTDNNREAKDSWVHYRPRT